MLPVASFCAPQRALVSYVDLPDGARPGPIAADSSGNLFVASSVLGLLGPPLRLRITKTDPHGAVLASLEFEGRLSDVISGLAVDANGDLVIVGNISSPDFPLVSPLIPNTTNPGLIAKIDSELKNILFSTRLGASIEDVALDAHGNIYVTGGTSDVHFPITPGAFQKQPPHGDAFGTAVYAFVTEISADGTKIMFSTYYGTDHVTCIGGSHCLGAYGHTGGSAIAVDTNGNVVIGGTTDADQLPVTAGVFGPTCGGCTSDLPASFFAKFTPGGDKLVWATYIPAVGVPFGGGITLEAMGFDSDRNIVIGGSTPEGFPVSTGALQTAFPAPDLSAGFVAKFDAAAERLLFATYFGGGASFGVRDLTVDSQDTIWITGVSPPQELPAPKGIPLLGPSYVAALSADGATVEDLFTAPEGAVGQAITQTGSGIVVLGRESSLLTVSPGMGPSLVGIANAAATHVSPTVAPYELISLYGIGIGPSIPASGKVVNGEAPTSLNGVQVLFDGVPGGLLYVGPNQINAIVPPNVVTRDRTVVEVVTPPSVTIDGPTMAVQPSQPGVFLNPIPPVYGILPAAALNQDGTLNSATNPATPGSIVSVWATGGGLLDLPVSVLRSEGELAYSLEVLYAGPAPGMVNGVVQINFRLPSAAAVALTLGYELQIGDALSDLFSIYVRK